MSNRAGGSDARREDPYQFVRLLAKFTATLLIGIIHCRDNTQPCERLVEFLQTDTLHSGHLP